jgi:hypothetical protein
MLVLQTRFECSLFIYRRRDARRFAEEDVLRAARLDTCRIGPHFHYCGTVLRPRDKIPRDLDHPRPPHQLLDEALTRVQQYGVGIRKIFARRGDDRDLHEYSETAHLSRAPHRALLLLC